MADLLDGTNIPWHIVSGKHEPGIQPDPLVLERVRARRTASQLPPPVTREPQKRLIAGGLFIAAALAESLRRFK